MNAQIENYSSKFQMTFDVAQEIGNDACDSWLAMEALCGLADSRIISGYAFEVKAFFSKMFF